MRGSGRIYERPTGSGNFWIAYYHRGQEQRESVTKALGKLTVTRRDAEKLLRARLGEVVTGKFLGLEAERVTVGELLRGYMANLELKGAKAMPQHRSAARRLYAAFDDVRAVELKPALVETTMHAWLEEGLTRGSVAQYISKLRAVLHLAFKQGRIQTRPYVPTLSVNNTRQGFLAPEDLEPFVAQLEAPIDDIARFAYLTGWRRGEVLGLQWTHVDFRAGEIRLGDTKNGHGRVIPLYWIDEHGQRQMLAYAQVLEKRRKLRALTPWVFHRDGKPVKRFAGAWAAAAAASKMPKLLLHDFRRSAVKNMLDAGVPEKVAMMVTGHRSWAIFQRYNIRNLSDVAAGLRQTELHVAAKAAQ